MRRACTIALLGVLGCSQVDRSTPKVSSETQSRAAMALTDLVHVGMHGAGVSQHPYVCGTGGDFPTGHETIFRSNESGEVHAVFPDGVTAPENLNGSFVLHGHYQGIQNRDRYTGKIPPSDYRYFVVASWERKK